MTQTTEQLTWIAADWGTSNLRIWLMANTGDVLHRISADCGMGSLTPDQFEPALMKLIAEHLPNGRTVPVVICGMAGAKQGWAEAPYSAVPSEPPNATTATRIKTKDSRIDVYILPGMKQNAPADVMRGEETQIAGFLAANPKFDGVICLPGTHTKWVHISAREVVSFRTFMTGELFALIADQSVLRHSTASSDWDAEAFAAAVDDAMSNPATLASKLFSIRAASLLHGQSNAVGRAKVSGLLIGAELAGARPYWLGQNIVILGEDGLSSAYQAALSAQGLQVQTVPSKTMTLAGLCAAYLALESKPQ